MTSNAITIQKPMMQSSANACILLIYINISSYVAIAIQSYFQNKSTPKGVIFV